MTASPATATPTAAAPPPTPAAHRKLLPVPSNIFAPPPAANSEAVVIHDVAELRAFTASALGMTSGAHPEFLSRIMCTVGGDRKEVLAALSPELNYQLIANRGGCGEGSMGRIERSGFAADHRFVRRAGDTLAADAQAPPTRPAGACVVKDVYAMCQGCVDKGYDRPAADIAPEAFADAMPDAPEPAQAAVEGRTAG